MVHNPLNQSKATSLHKQMFIVYASLRSVRLFQVPTEGFLPEDGNDMDNSPLTVAVSCLMSYEHTGVCVSATCSSYETTCRITLQ